MNGSEAREVIEGAVRRELFGPSSGEEEKAGRPLDCSTGVLRFENKEASRGQFYEATTHEEILNQSDPLHRYGIGVLHGGAASLGAASRLTTDEEYDDDVDITWVSGTGESEENPEGTPFDLKGKLRHDNADSDDFDLTDANKFKPSAMAISFKVRLCEGGSLKLNISGAYYDQLIPHIPGVRKVRPWWLRRPFVLNASILDSHIRPETNVRREIPTTPVGDEVLRISPAVQVYFRPVPGEHDSELRLVTVAVLNHTPGVGPAEALFQIGLTVTAENGHTIEAYHEVEQDDLDAEEQSIELLYRKKRTFAVGHGCAAEWGGEDTAKGSVSWVRADPLPAYEVASLTPNVYITDSGGERKSVTVSMEALASGSPEGKLQVEVVLRLYDEWISAREEEVTGLILRFQEAARRHIKLCRDALKRMRTGWELVASDPVAERAFRLANEAMLFQQVRSRLPYRKVESTRDGTLRPSGDHPTATPQPGQGHWRPFQIAFILASLPEIVEPERPTRSLVDLIFFPTGGGKTEAYLGASAISLLVRRLRNPSDSGTDTLMRYTLRLLTAQQFLRAASLICVLEDIRSKNLVEIGQSPFGIGIWLGGSSTPNKWDQAIQSLKRMRNSPQEQNVFLLLRCPWCGTQMGARPRGRNGQDIIGYEQVGKKVVLRCIDESCRFSSRKGLPIHIVDEDIYEVRPSIVIGTVDKFAMLAWRPMARRLFGLGTDGSREVSPPGLIIQDELHLISGPLGSMVGLYEPVIHELCTDRRNDKVIPPKIIASTATVRRYEDQIKGIFGRTEVALFPPHGLEEGHSFFAETATYPNGTPAPGRRYLGIMSASFGSTQTVQVRVAAATLQGATNIPTEARDGYWTNLNFLNSLRELGNTVSLLESDVPDYLTAIRRRDGIKPRWPRVVMELTSRRRNDEIPKAIQQLETKHDQDGCIDICLASNIIEVGVDIDRLGLMTIVGQPKTTAQYIQVSGRVGRRAEVSPGLVITIYGAAKPRDRSHYERFYTYHQQLYAQVEPTSVTPFATPVLRRALHAATIAHIRQVTPGIEPHPFPETEYNDAIALLRERVMIVDPKEAEAVDDIAEKRAREWSNWERTTWEANSIGGDPLQGLMRFAGTLPDHNSKATIWDVPTSMRNVDAECRLKISLAYTQEDAEGGDE